jgi:hypothetical protein
VNIIRHEKCLRDHAAGQVLGLVSVAGVVRAHCVREPRWV